MSEEILWSSIKLVLVGVLWVLTCVHAYEDGEKRGRAIGWNEKQMQVWAKDRERREKNGRFKGRARA